MAKKAQTGNVGAYVAAAASAAAPAAWSDRYRYDFDTGTVVARSDGGHVPKIFQHIKFDKDGKIGQVPELAVAAAPVMGMSGSWDPSDFASWDTTSLASDDKDDLRRSRKWWKKDPVVARCVLMLAQLANSQFTISCANEGFREIVDNWRKTAMGHSFMQQWFLEYFRSGFVPVLKTLIEYIPRDFKSNKIPQLAKDENVEAALGSATTSEDKTLTLMQQSQLRLRNYKQALATYETAQKNYEVGLCSFERLEIYRDAVARTQYEWMKGTIPGAYTLLDPLLVDMDGPKEMGLLRQPFLQISEETRNAIANPVPQMKGLVQTLPSEMVAQIKAGKPKVWMSPNICSVTFGQKQDYERYPTPLVSHAFDALRMKAELMAMDEATAKSTKNRILLVKLGSDEFPEFDSVKIGRVQQMFATPSRTMTLVWNHCINLEWIEPDQSTLMDQDKYRHWNSEIRTAFGISEVLVGSGQTTGSSGNMMSFKGVEELIQEAQNKFLQFFQKEVRMLKAALGISAEVLGKFDDLNLKDEVAFWGVLNQAVMNGLLDHQSALEILRFNFPEVEQRMKKMKALKEKGLFVPIPSANNLGPDGSALPNKGGVPGALGGKPKGQPKKANQQKKGKAQPKLKAKAYLQPVDEDHVAIVVDTEELTAEYRQDVAEHFNAPFDWIMTRAEFEAKHPGMEVGPAWPSLAAPDMVAVFRDSAVIGTQVSTAFESAVANLKGADKPGRKPYLTQNVKDDLSNQALEQTLASYRKEMVGDVIPKSWGKYLADTTKELQDACPGTNPQDLHINAWVMVAHRCKKHLANQVQ